MSTIQRHRDLELKDFEKRLLTMGALVESQLQDALLALTTCNSGLATRVVKNDLPIDRLDVEIDGDCLRYLAVHHPIAGELRFITTAMKIAGELERISDMAENIAERVIELNREPQLKPYIDIPVMGKRAIGMVKDALNAFVKRDATLAQKVCQDDALVDDLTEQLFRELLSFMLEDRNTVSRAVRLTFIGKYFERIADHATNMAELVVYMVEGKIIRHLPAADGSVSNITRLQGP